MSRFLDGQPVTARPPSTAYVLRKFVRRHRQGVVAAAAGVCLLVAALIISLLYWRQSHVYAQKLEAANQLAIETVKSLTHNVDKNLRGFKLVDQEVPERTTPLQRARIETADLLAKIGIYLNQIGVSPKEQEKWFKRANEEFASLHAELSWPLSISYATSLDRAASVAGSLGNWAEAVALHRQNIQLLEDYLQGHDTPDHVQQLGLSYNTLALCESRVENTTKAIDLLEQAKNITKAHKAALGMAYHTRNKDGDLERAIQLFRQSQSNMELATALNNLALAQENRGDLDEADSTSRAAIDAIEKVLNGNRRDQAALRTAIMVYHNAGKRHFIFSKDFESATEMYEHAVENAIAARKLGPSILSDRLYVFAYLGLAECRMAQDKFIEAEKYWDRALEGLEYQPALRDKWWLYFTTRRIRCIAAGGPETALTLMEKLPLRDVTVKYGIPEADTLFTVAELYSIAAGENDANEPLLERAFDAIQQLQTQQLLSEDHLESFANDSGFRALRESGMLDDILAKPSQ
ncbi:MAG: tetratricopeptide repeat protein [Planctomycetota bacterium]